MIKLLLPTFLMLTSFNKVYATNAFTAELVHIRDGDTIDVLIDGKKQGIRLKCADTPESVLKIRGETYSQIFQGRNIGEIASDFLKEHLEIGDIVKLVCENGNYNRLTCEVEYKGYNISDLLIGSGYAYGNSKGYCSQYRKVLQEQAMQYKKGLWSLGFWQDPAEFRAVMRK